jgi:hypothetical protein
MMFSKDHSAIRQGGSTAFTALVLIAGTVGFVSLPMPSAAFADQGSGHGGGGHDGGSNSGPGNSGREDHARGGADDPADHDLGDDQAHQDGADDPADHDLNDDHGDDSAVLQPPVAN